MSTASADVTRSVRNSAELKTPRQAFSWTDLSLLFLTIASCTVYLWYRLHIGWLPEDDGLLGQSALRVLHGQLPHVDFLENYTGGLDYLHAITFRLFGVNAFSMRTALLALSIPFLASVFYIASRLAGTRSAALLTVLAAVWSVPTYPTPMPSWYNLYFAVFGAAAVMRYIATGRLRWLFLAGIFGGLSFDVKVVGLYYIAAILLFLVYREQESSAIPAAQGKRTYIYSSFVISALALFMAAVAKLVGGNLQEGDAVHFLLPSLAVVVSLIWREVHTRATGERERFRSLLRTVAPFLAGCIVPVLILLVPYIRTGHLHTFFVGVFAKGLDRAMDLTRIHAELAELGLALPPLAFLWLASRWEPMRRTAAAVVVAVVLVLVLLLAIRSSGFSESVFYSVSMMTPWVVAFGAWLLCRSKRDEEDRAARQQCMLLLSVVAVCSLVQFPFPAPIYFCYFAPLLALALFALAGHRARAVASGPVAAFLVFYVLFGIFRVVPGKLYADGKFSKHPASETLKLPRAGGIKIERAAEYERLIQSLKSHSRGSYVVATPECPDIYFFSGSPNLANTDGSIPPAQLAEFLSREDVYAVVLNREPYFARYADINALREQYRTRFPYSEVIGKYLLMWR